MEGRTGKNTRQNDFNISWLWRIGYETMFVSAFLHCDVQVAHIGAAISLCHVEHSFLLQRALGSSCENGVTLSFRCPYAISLKTVGWLRTLHRWCKTRGWTMPLSHRLVGWTFWRIYVCSLLFSPAHSKATLLPFLNRNGNP